AALMLSGMPFEGPVGGIRMGLKKGEWIPFPTETDLDESVFELVVAGRRNASGGIDIIMVEAGATAEGIRLIEAGDRPSDEEAVAEGIEQAKPYIAQLIDLQNELAAKAGKKDFEWVPAVDYTEDVYQRVEVVAAPKIANVITIAAK